MYKDEVFDFDVDGEHYKTSLITWTGMERSYNMNIRAGAVVTPLHHVLDGYKDDPESILIKSGTAPIGYVPRRFSGKHQLYNALLHNDNMVTIKVYPPAQLTFQFVEEHPLTKGVKGAMTDAERKKAAQQLKWGRKVLTADHMCAYGIQKIILVKPNPDSPNWPYDKDWLGYLCASGLCVTHDTETHDVKAVPFTRKQVSIVDDTSLKASLDVSSPGYNIKAKIHHPSKPEYVERCTIGDEVGGEKMFIVMMEHIMNKHISYEALAEQSQDIITEHVFPHGLLVRMRRKP